MKTFIQYFDKLFDSIKYISNIYSIFKINIRFETEFREHVCIRFSKNLFDSV